MIERNLSKNKKQTLSEASRFTRICNQPLAGLLLRQPEAGNITGRSETLSPKHDTSSFSAAYFKQKDIFFKFI
jgi:hypothetical protein